MSIVVDAAGYDQGPRLLRLDLPACIAFAGLGALVLSPRLGSLSGLLFLAAGGLLLVSDIERSSDCTAPSFSREMAWTLAAVRAARPGVRAMAIG